MNDDTISRQAAIDAIEKLVLPQTRGNTEAEEINLVAWRCAINCAEEMLGHLPSAERRGRWIEDEFGSKCSSCGRYAPRIKDGLGSECRYPDKYGEPLESLYCPNCGAKMDLEENDG